MKVIAVKSRDVYCTSMSVWQNLAVGEAIGPPLTLAVLLVRGSVGVKRLECFGCNSQWKTDDAPNKLS